MSDIQEEQKRLYKRAEENDLKSFSKNFIIGVKIKSNVQKKNNTPAVVIKKKEK